MLWVRMYDRFRVIHSDVLFCTCLGQILCTQFWKTEYRPRNYLPWGITIGSYVGDWIIILAIRYYLKRENARRDRIQFSQDTTGLEGGLSDKPGELIENEKSSQPHQQKFGVVQRIGEDGVITRRKVDKGLLDLTVSSLWPPFLSLN